MLLLAFTERVAEVDEGGGRVDTNKTTAKKFGPLPTYIYSLHVPN
jgi:hypothetical protein